MANYTIIGGDGKEYGPISAEELRKWKAEGRVDAQTKVRAEGTTDWLLLSQVPELAGTPGQTAPPPFPPKAPPAADKLSTMAVLALVFGILALPTCGSTALFGLILGIIAMVKVSNSRGQLRGKGIALAGVIVSGISVLLLPVLAAMLLPAFAAAKLKAQAINCMNNEKQLMLTVRMYSQSNSNHLPPAATWCDAIKPSLGGASEMIFQCPAADPANRCAYAFNTKLDGMDLHNVNPQTVVIFESDSGWNAHGGPEIAAPQRHHNTLNVAFADGHVERVTDGRFNSLRWDP
jgi:prepilin-type processing-associated H-X9-DG protein